METAVQKREADILDKLAAQAHMFVQGACMNLLQLGRVLTEAKPLVSHGEWDNWIRTNAKMSRRTAEQYMQAYAEFGLNSQIAELGTTKVLKLLPMPQEDRDRLLSENDVAGMSTRQLEAAIKEQKERLVKEARAEVQGEINSEREARLAAEKRAAEAENRPPEVPKELQDELQAAREREKTQRAEIDRINATRDSERERLQRENEQLRRDIKDLDATLEEQQEDYNRAQEELLNLKSTIAKGDAERVPVDHLTVDTFASAVRAFIGTCARMPQMDAAFSTMDLVEKNAYDELLRTMEVWARDSRKALNTVTIEGTVIINE